MTRTARQRSRRIAGAFRRGSAATATTLAGGVGRAGTAVGRRLPTPVTEAGRRLRNAALQRLVTGSGDGPADLSKLRVIPRSVRYPLLREGLDPVPALARSREGDGIAKLISIFGRTVWLVSGHEAARAVLSDSETYSNDIRPLVRPNGGSDAEGIGGLGSTDAPDHTKLRRYLTPEFTMRRLARLEPRITQIVADRLDALEASGPVVDLVEGFAFAVPFRVICELLGLPEDKRHVLAEVGPQRFDLTNPGQMAFGSAVGARQFWFDVVAELREHPNDGLISALIAEHGDDLDDVTLGGLADGLFLGGYETSASMLALGTLTLIEHPSGVRLFDTDDRDTITRMVEELLRYLSVVQVGFLRFARTDHRIGDVDISTGDVVAVSMSGANRDPAAFGPGAERFDPERPAGPHVGFGYGVHRCVGAELARMELRIAFRELARRFPDLTLADRADALRYRELSIVYGIEALPVRLHGVPAPV